MRDRFTTSSTNNKTPIYSYSDAEWVRCPNCGNILFRIVEKKGSRIEIKCKNKNCKEVTQFEI